MNSENILAISRLDRLVTAEEREAASVKKMLEEQLQISKDALALARAGADTELAKKAAEIHASYLEYLAVNAEAQKILKRWRREVDEFLALFALDKKYAQC